MTNDWIPSVDELRTVSGNAGPGKCWEAIRALVASRVPKVREEIAAAYDRGFTQGQKFTPARESVDVEPSISEMRAAYYKAIGSSTVNGSSPTPSLDAGMAALRSLCRSRTTAPPRDSSPAASGAFVEAADAIRNAFRHEKSCGVRGGFKCDCTGMEMLNAYDRARLEMQTPTARERRRCEVREDEEVTLRAQVFQVIYDATRDRRTAREMGGVFEELDPYVDRVMALLAAPVRDAAESVGSALDDILCAEAGARIEGAGSMTANEAAVAIVAKFADGRAELSALRARVAGLEGERDALQSSLDASRDLVVEMTDERDALRTEIERLNHHGDMLRGQLHVELTSHEATRVIARDARALLAVELRANANLRVALELSRCECSLSVQPPHAFKCRRCSALDDERLRALAQPRAERETKDV